jgi:hypothetical protein
VKSKLVLCLVLVLSGGLCGCSTTPPAAGTKVFDYSTDCSPASEGLVLKGLGKRLSIRVEADSWPALIEKVKPTFAWNGCDMMWIEKDKLDRPQFVLDEAYMYQPTNQPRCWVLLDQHDAPYDEWYGGVMGNNLRGVATLHKTVPIADNDAGEIGEYAVVKSTHPRFGTVYEIGWPKLMANGSGLCEECRLLYVLKDRANQWRFLGEGIGNCSGKSGITGIRTSVESRVIWTRSRTQELPLQIQFLCQTYESEASDDPDFIPRPDWVTYHESVLTGPIPAHFRPTTERSHLLTGKDDTFNKIVQHCAEWCFDWNRWPDHDGKIVNEKIVEIWRTGLARLNPQLPRTGNIKEGTRVQILTDAETAGRLKTLEKAARK